jgi:hypothetical protein
LKKAENKLQRRAEKDHSKDERVICGQKLHTDVALAICFIE